MGYRGCLGGRIFKQICKTSKRKQKREIETAFVYLNASDVQKPEPFSEV